MFKKNDDLLMQKRMSSSAMPLQKPQNSHYVTCPLAGSLLL